MKKASKIIITIIIILVTIGLVLPIFNFAAQDPNANPLSAPLNEVISSVDELASLKDNTELTDEQKAAKELELRKDSLLKILDLSLLEINGLSNKIASTTTENKDQENTKNYLINFLNESINYIKTIKNRLDAKELYLSEIKNLAQEFKDWREKVYNQIIKKSLIFSLIMQEKAALKIADTRVEKILIDLKKLENASLLKKDEGVSLLVAPNKNLSNAHSLNNKAENMLMKNIDFNQEISSTTILAFNDITATNTINDIDENSIKLLIQKSLDEIKNAYKSFLDISIKIKKKLGLQN